MRTLIIILLSTLAIGATLPDKGPESKAKVYIFLAAGCPCAYSHQQTFGSMIKKFGDRVDFYAVFIDKNDDQEEIDDMMKNLGWKLKTILDKKKVLAKLYRPEVTTNCVLVAPDGKPLYKGAVDDSVQNYGQVINFYLKNALEDYVAGRPVRVKEGEGVGCYLNYNQ